MEEISIYRHVDSLYTEENVSMYKPGGFHPVCLGDTFKDGRYEIYHKLGFGGYSTVWLAKDKQTKLSQEVEILQQLRSYSPENISSKCIVTLLDYFIHPGPNGNHQCLVFELLGPRVDKVLQDYYDSRSRPQSQLIIRLSEQLLKAMAFIHEAGLGHGDINGRNIAFSSSRLSKLTHDSLFEVLGTPEIDKFIRIDGKPLDKGLPTYLVESARWTDWLDESEEDLRILDFGESFIQGTQLERLAQPGPLRVPESIFAESLDYRVDLWRAGCMIYSFIFLALPFQFLGGDAALVAQMIGFVEMLPAEWQSKWDNMRLNSGGKVQLEDSEVTLLSFDTISSILVLPSDRISASQALDLLRSEREKQGNISDSDSHSHSDSSSEGDSESSIHG
ncbi:hypothetical protein B7463_g7462, partial [Scytalidium lignicola]